MLATMALFLIGLLKERASAYYDGRPHYWLAQGARKRVLLWRSSVLACPRSAQAHTMMAVRITCLPKERASVCCYGALHMDAAHGARQHLLLWCSIKLSQERASSCHYGAPTYLGGQPYQRALARCLCRSLLWKSTKEAHA